MWKVLVCVALICAGVHGGEPAESGFDPERPVARIGDAVITAGDFQKDLSYRWYSEMYRRGVAPEAVTPPPPEFRKLALNELVNAHVVRMLAENEQVEVSNDEVDAELLRSALLDEQQRIEQYLEKEGITEDALREDVRQRLRVKKYLAGVASAVEVGEETVRAEYERMKAAGTLTRPQVTYDIEHVFIATAADTPDAWNDAFVRVERARQRILAGEAFSAVAEEMSDDEDSADYGGMYYEASPAEMPKAVKENLAELEVGALSEVFKSELGYHVMRIVSENKPGETPEFESLKRRIEDAIRARLATEELRKRVEAASRIVAIELYPAVADEVKLEQPGVE